jgi:general secretion pathway protein D
MNSRGPIIAALEGALKPAALWAAGRIGLGLILLRGAAFAQQSGQGASAGEASPNRPVEQSLDLTAATEASEAFDLEPTNEHSSFDLRRPTLHVLYDAIGSAFGIGIVYDEELGAASVSGDFRLEDVTLQEALDAAGNISRTFVAPLDQHRGIVAADTPAKRGQYERQILRSFRLDSALTPQQISEVTNALRTIVDIRRVSQDNRNNWITVTGRIRQIKAAKRFIESVDKPNGEVMLEFEVWEIDLNRARQMGVLPPQQFTLKFLGKGRSGFVPLPEWGQLTTLYGVQIPNLTAFLTYSKSLARVHERMHLRASDGEEAQLLIGERLPVVTGSISSVITEGTTNPTQTAANAGYIPGIQYQDVGVVIHATPHLHALGNTTLQLDFALRAVGPNADNGLPTFTNRQVTSQVRFSYDEAYLIGGLLSRKESINEGGYPWLSKIPILGLLFGRREPQSSDTELLILVKPTILRSSPAEQFAPRAIYFGRELSGLPAPPPVPVEQPPQPAAQPPQPGVPPVPGQPPQSQPGGFPTPGQPQPGAAPVPVPGQTPVPGAAPIGVPLPQGFPQGFAPGQQAPGQQGRPLPPETGTNP